MNLLQWANQWGVSLEAVRDLERQMGTFSDIGTPDRVSHGQSEASVSNRVRLEATSKGARLWRNNVGAAMDDRGVPVRYGLCNESSAMNRAVKSSDLIGIAPTIVTPDMVGQRFGRFLAREVKHAGWQYTGTPHEAAQKRFLDVVVSLGGDAAFCNCEGTL